MATAKIQKWTSAAPGLVKIELVDAPAAIASLTDSSGGTASDTIAAIGGTYAQAEVQNAVASLAAKIEALTVALRNNAHIQV